MMKKLVSSRWNFPVVESLGYGRRADWLAGCVESSVDAREVVARCSRERRKDVYGGWSSKSRPEVIGDGITHLWRER